MNNVVYQITSPSGNRYIGSARNPDRRKYEHIRLLKRGTHHSRALQRAWDKYGDVLTFSVLLVCRENDLFYYEQRCIDGLRPKYNASPSATGTRGLKWSAESKAKMNIIRKRLGAALSKEQRAKLARLAISNLHTPESKQKSCVAKKTPEFRAAAAARATGKIPSIETRRKRALTTRESWKDESVRNARMIGMAANSRPSGWKHSDEAKLKMRGRKISDETKQKLRESHVGQPGPMLGRSHTESSRNRISVSLKGRARSPEAIAKHLATNAAKRQARQSVDFEIKD